VLAGTGFVGTILDSGPRHRARGRTDDWGIDLVEIVAELDRGFPHRLGDVEVEG
jgi:hypothetical protein